jgi:RNA polymerase sigma-70 factor (ECF subfamily)
MIVEGPQSGVALELNLLPIKPRHKRSNTDALKGNAMRRQVPSIVPTAADEEWRSVQRAINGDWDAFAALFMRDRDRLYRAAFSLLSNREDAEDALLSAYLNLKSFAGRTRFSTWHTRIVLNSALMNRRRSRARFHGGLLEGAIDEAQLALARAADQRPDPESAYSFSETCENVEKGMTRLSPCLRSAFYPSNICELPAGHAAAKSGVKVSAMKSRTTRARRRLTSLLTAESTVFPTALSHRTGL